VGIRVVSEFRKLCSFNGLHGVVRLLQDGLSLLDLFLHFSHHFLNLLVPLLDLALLAEHEYPDLLTDLLLGL
jgi:hypothetical protein